MKSDSGIPGFGDYSPEISYIIRPGGYSVIFDTSGKVAVVSISVGLFLPGGGQYDGESAEAAAIRETEEECGWKIGILKHVGLADEFLFLPRCDAHYQKRCTFFTAEILGETEPTEPDHTVLWLPTERAVKELRHESQQWAVRQAAVTSSSEESSARNRGGRDILSDPEVG